MSNYNLKGFSKQGESIWANMSDTQKDIWLNHEKSRMDKGYLTKRERDILSFLIEVRRKEKADNLNKEIKKKRRGFGNIIRRFIEEIGRRFFHVPRSIQTN